MFFIWGGLAKPHESPLNLSRSTQLCDWFVKHVQRGQVFLTNEKQRSLPARAPTR